MTTRGKAMKRKARARELVPIEAYNRIVYQCLKCKEEFFGNFPHQCKVKEVSKVTAKGKGK